MYIQLPRYKRLQAHEISPSVNGGRRWNHAWPNTSINLWDKAVEMVPHDTRDRPMHQVVLAMFCLRTPNPEPMRMLLENALTDLDHPLHDLRFIKSKNAYRSYAQYAEVAPNPISNLARGHTHRKVLPKYIGVCGYLYDE